jgi:predicted Zn-dependent peptidase
MGLERPSARAEQIAAHLLAYGRVVPVEELTAKLEAVDARKVREFGARIMASPTPAIAAIGPVAKLESYANFVRRFGASTIRVAAAE